MPVSQICPLVPAKPMPIRIRPDQNVNKKAYTTTQKVIVNINTASVQELCTIRMIGETKAKAIVNYREKYGDFKDKGDIVKVYGIGEKTYEKIKDSICVN